jgi:hypothetical protein
LHGEFEEDCLFGAVKIGEIHIKPVQNTSIESACGSVAGPIVGIYAYGTYNG